MKTTYVWVSLGNAMKAKQSKAKQSKATCSDQPRVTSQHWQDKMWHWHLLLSTMTSGAAHCRVTIQHGA
jgi:hypothetical protein